MSTTSTVRAASIAAYVTSATDQYLRDEVRAIVAGTLDATREAKIISEDGDIVCHVRAAAGERPTVSLYGYDRRSAAIAAAGRFFDSPVKHVRDTDTYGDFLASCEVRVG